MADVRISIVPVEINAEAVAVMHSTPPDAINAPGGLYPMMARAYEMDDYRLMAGWPVEVPDYDVHVKTLVSCEGEVLGFRESPTDIQTEALIRWVADDNLWDPTTLRWTSLYSQVNPVAWEAPSGHEPVLVDYEYRVADERFYLKALNFDSDNQNYLETSLDGLVSGAGYTVLMVMSPNSVYSNNTAVPYNGLWSPVSKDTPWVEVSTQGQYLWHQTESTTRTRTAPISSALNSTTPFYVAMVIERPTTTLYVADGPTSMRVQTVPSGTPGQSLDLSVYLGRSTEDLLHTADMALLDLSIYPDRLSGAEVRDEIALLSQAYGGDSQ